MVRRVSLMNNEEWHKTRREPCSRASSSRERSPPSRYSSDDDLPQHGSRHGQRKQSELRRREYSERLTKGTQGDTRDCECVQEALHLLAAEPVLGHRVVCSKHRVEKSDDSSLGMVGRPSAHPQIDFRRPVGRVAKWVNKHNKLLYRVSERYNYVF